LINLNCRFCFASADVAAGFFMGFCMENAFEVYALKDEPRNRDSGQRRPKPDSDIDINTPSGVSHTKVEEEDLYNEYGERPLSVDERAILRSRIKRAEVILRDTIKGQDQAIEPVLDALKRAVTGTRDEGRPIATILELGPTGTGKTLLAKTLASALSARGGAMDFGFIKIDCSEYSQGHEVSRLTGAPPGYVGYDKGSQLDPIEENPFHVVLFDEIEKGDKKLHNLLLQILEDGALTLGNGTKLSFRNCIVIMSSNAGVDAIEEARNTKHIGFTREENKEFTPQQIKEITSAALSKIFPPEFINRVDEVVPFGSLAPNVVREIANNEVRKAVGRTERNTGCHIEVASEVLDFLAKEGYSPKFGAREVRRVVDKFLTKMITDALYEIDPNDQRRTELKISMKDGELSVKRKIRPEQPKPEPVA